MLSPQIQNGGPGGGSDSRRAIPDVHDQHKAAFGQFSAFVILDSLGELVGTVALKLPPAADGRLHAYVHLIGVQMVRGRASGCRYDKRSDAVADAIAKVPAPGISGGLGDQSERLRFTRAKLQASLATRGQNNWIGALEKSGYRVLQAV